MPEITENDREIMNRLEKYHEIIRNEGKPPTDNKKKWFNDYKPIRNFDELEQRILHGKDS